jgi:dihydroorotate dehydrogenase (NAD+) catalytic subunit
MSENAVIELAPHHKTGLALTNPVMPAAGCFGFGMEYAKLVKVEALGAVVVGPVTVGKRKGANPPRIVPLSGGVLLHTGLANPGIATVVRRHTRAWIQSPVPVIVHVAGTSPGETASCCWRLANIEAVAGIEIGLPDSAKLDDGIAIIQAAHTATNQPLIVRLPLISAELLCKAVVEAGADALTVAAPPRGTAWHRPSERFITGRLYGPLVHPLALHTLRRLTDLVSVPLIGCGGVYSEEDAQAFLHAGAVAVQVSGALWHDPACLVRIARSLS